MNRSNFYFKALIALVTVFLLLVAAKVYFKSSEHMNRSPQEALSQLQSGEHLATLREFNDTPMESLYLIDLRSKHQFELGHLDGAVNMPMRSLEQKSQQDLIQQALDSDKSVFIYAEKMHDAEGTWLLLYQMGLDDVQVIQIDVQSTTGILKATELTDPVEMDYASIYKELSTKPVKKVKAAPTPKKAVQPIQKKKKRSPEGGC